MRLSIPAGLAVALTACAPTPRPALYQESGPHYGDAWFAYRAKGLGLTEEAARVRDARLSEEAPPDIWDTQTQAEARALWAVGCAKCHGARGQLEGVPAQDPMPRAWGSTGAQMGFFFGGDKMRAGIYRRIRDAA